MYIQRISDFFKALPHPPQLTKKASSFKPATRLQKIHNKELIYPISTQNKYIFISNLDGSGFQRAYFHNCPEDINLDKMIAEINICCYKQWKANRDYYQKHPFQKLDLFSNLSMLVAMIIAVIMLVLVLGGEIETFTTYLFLFLFFLGTSLIISLVVYFTTAPPYDSDRQMIAAIRAKLKEFNDKQILQRNIGARFIWTSHKECLWIAIRMLNL